jgi:hypothetical protein
MFSLRSRKSQHTHPRVRPQLERLEERDTPSLTGSQFLVSGQPFDNGFGPTSASYPSSASSLNGMSVAAWTELHPDLNFDAIKIQIFNTSGQKFGNAVTVTNSFTGAFTSVPSVAMDTSANTYIAWSDTNGNVFAAKYNASGVRQGSIVTVAATNMKEYDPSIAVSGPGEVVISYTRDASSSNRDVVARRFTAAFSAISTFFVANSSANEYASRVARTDGADQRFSIAYQVGGDVYVKRYNNTGILLGTSAVATGTNFQGVPRLDIDRAGNTVVAWQELVGSQWNIYARRITATGGFGSTLAIATTTRNETLAGVAVDKSDGDFVLSYQSRAGTSGPSIVYATEFSSAGIRKGTYSLGTQSSFAGPAISINGADRYFVTYIGPLTFTDDLNGSETTRVIYSRFGTLV